MNRAASTAAALESDDRSEFTALRTLSEPDAARLIGVSRKTLLRARQRGELSYVRLGDRVVYRAKDIEAFLERSAHQPRSRKER